MNEKTRPTKAMLWVAPLVCALWPAIGTNAQSSAERAQARVEPQWVMLNRIQVADQFPLIFVDFNSIDTGAHPAITLLLDYRRKLSPDGFAFTAQTIRYDVDCEAGLLRPTKITYREWSTEIGHLAQGSEIEGTKGRQGFQDLPIRESFLGSLCFLHKRGFAFPDMSYDDNWTEIRPSSADHRTFIAPSQKLTKGGLVLNKTKTVSNQTITVKDIVDSPSNTEAMVSAYDCKAGESHRIVSVRYSLSGYPIETRLFVGTIDTPQASEDKAELSKSCPANVATLPDLRIAADMNKEWEVLTDALKKGELDSVKSYLAAHPSALNRPIPTSLMTPLEVALEQEHLELAEALIDAGADVNFVGPKGVTILHRAAFFNRVPVVSLLLKHGAHTEVYDDNGRSPLYYATEHGSLDAVLALVKGGANPDSWDPSQHPSSEQGNARMVPLEAAISAKNKEVALALIEMGASPNLVDAWQSSPLDNAVLNLGWSDVVKRLLEKGARCDSVHNNRLAAEFTRDPESFKLVTECVTRATGKTPDLTMPLGIAAMSGNNEALKAFLKMGADPNAVAKAYSARPLALALQSPTPIETMAILVNAGADINAVDAGGTALLHLLALRPRPGASEIVDWIIQHGGNINAPVSANLSDTRRPNQGFTPLHFAAENGQIETARLMLEKGANVNAAASDGQTPLTLAIQHQHGDTARLLIEHGAQVEGSEQHGPTPLLLAAQAEDVETMRLLLDKGANPNRNSSTEAGQPGRSPLTTAIRAGSVTIVTLLLKGGADPNLRDGAGELPLDLAIVQNKREMVELLKASHANRTPSETPAGSVTASAAARKADASLCAKMAQMERAGQLERKEIPMAEDSEPEASSVAEELKFVPRSMMTSVTLGQRQFLIGRDQGNLTLVMAVEKGQSRLLCTFSGKGKSTRVHSPAARLVMFAKESGEDPVTFAMKRPGPDYVEALLGGIATQPELAFLKGREGLTAMLYKAIEERRMDTLTLLLERKVDPNPNNEMLRSNPEHPGEASIQKMLQLMTAYSSPNSTPLRQAAEARSRDGVRLLLKYGADPDVGEVDGAGYTPLDSAIRHHDRPMAEDLLRHGADPGGGGAFGLSEIIERHDNEMLSLLLAYGLDISSANLTLSDLKRLADEHGNPEAFALVSSSTTKGRIGECSMADPSALSESCLPRRLREADRELGQFYRAALARSTPAGLAQLRNGQRQWLKQRNTACRLVLEPSTEGGWRSYVLGERSRAICVLRQIEGRVAHLRAGTSISFPWAQHTSAHALHVTSPFSQGKARTCQPLNVSDATLIHRLR